MRTALIACKTLEKEITSVLEHEDVNIGQVYYVPSGLHNTTSRLQEAVREQMRKLEGQKIDRLLLCFGLCGNVVEGLETGDYETVLPKTDDCITLLLGSPERRKQLDETKRGYFLTEGWLQGEANIHKEYMDTVELYGRETADEIYEQMLHGYRYLTLIDTKQPDFAAFMREGERIAKDLKLTPLVTEGDLTWLKQYLSEDMETLMMEDKVVIYPPHSKMSFMDFVREENPR